MQNNQQNRKPAHNRRLAQWRVKWLIEYSTSHKLLWCIDSFVLRNPPLRQAPKLTPDGVLKGLNVIRSFYEEVFKIVPKGSAFEMKQMFIRDNIAYIAWNCESSFVKIPIGADTFIVENGKIKYQTLGAHIIPK